MLIGAEAIAASTDTVAVAIGVVTDTVALIIMAADITELIMAGSIAVIIMDIMGIMVPASVLALVGGIQVSVCTLVHYREDIILFTGIRTHIITTEAHSIDHTMVDTKWWYLL